MSYVFEPGDGRDGASVSVRLAQLNQLHPEPFSWQVPGLRTELATELIRHLPKQVRTSFVPAPDRAREALAWLDEHQPDHSRRFCDELGRALRALTGVAVEPEDWHPDEVPTHLQVGFVVATPGKPDRFSRNLGELRQELSAQVSRTLTKAAPKVAESTSWTFGRLQSKVTIKRSGITAIGYPALKDLGQAVGVIIAETPEQQAPSTAGASAGCWCSPTRPTRWTVSHLSNTDKMVLPSSPYPNVPLCGRRPAEGGRQCAARRLDTATVRDQQTYESLAVQFARSRPINASGGAGRGAGMRVARQIRAQAARRRSGRRSPISWTIWYSTASSDSSMIPGTTGCRTTAGRCWRG